MGTWREPNATMISEPNTEHLKDPVIAGYQEAVLLVGPVGQNIIPFVWEISTGNTSNHLYCHFTIVELPPHPLPPSQSAVSAAGAANSSFLGRSKSPCTSIV